MSEQHEFVWDPPTDVTDEAAQAALRDALGGVRRQATVVDLPDGTWVHTEPANSVVPGIRFITWVNPPDPRLGAQVAADLAARLASTTGWPVWDDVEKVPGDA